MNLRATERRIAGGSPTRSVVVRELPVWLFSELHEFSNIALEMLEPSYVQELMQYNGNRFVS